MKLFSRISRSMGGRRRRPRITRGSSFFSKSHHGRKFKGAGNRKLWSGR
jgi:hypothetical protein